MLDRSPGFVSEHFAEVQGILRGTTMVPFSRERERNMWCEGSDDGDKQVTTL